MGICDLHPKYGWWFIFICSGLSGGVYQVNGSRDWLRVMHYSGCLDSGLTGRASGAGALSKVIH